MLSMHENKTRPIFGTWDQFQTLFPMRYHKQVEICLVHKGSLVLTVGEQTYTLKKGDMYVIFPNVIHAVVPQELQKMLWMFSPELVPTLSIAFTSLRPKCPMIRANQTNKLVPDLIERCITLFRQDPAQHHSLLLTHTAALMQELLLLMELEKWEADPDIVQQLTGYLSESYQTNISLESAATALGYSKFYISRISSEQFGCNFRTLVNNYRISAAQELLLNKGLSIWQIAYACGFQNLSTFNRAFIRVCGMTPTQYRQRHCSYNDR